MFACIGFTSAAIGHVSSRGETTDMLKISEVRLIHALLFLLRCVRKKLQPSLNWLSVSLFSVISVVVAVFYVVGLLDLLLFTVQYCLYFQHLQIFFLLRRNAITFPCFLNGLVVSPSIQMRLFKIRYRGIPLFCQRSRKKPRSHHINIILLRTYGCRQT